MWFFGIIYIYIYIFIYIYKWLGLKTPSREGAVQRFILWGILVDLLNYVYPNKLYWTSWGGLCLNGPPSTHPPTHPPQNNKKQICTSDPIRINQKHEKYTKYTVWSTQANQSRIGSSIKFFKIQKAIKSKWNQSKSINVRQIKSIQLNQNHSN